MGIAGNVTGTTVVPVTSPSGRRGSSSVYHVTSSASAIAQNSSQAVSITATRVTAIPRTTASVQHPTTIEPRPVTSSSGSSTPSSAPVSNNVKETSHHGQRFVEDQRSGVEFSTIPPSAHYLEQRFHEQPRVDVLLTGPTSSAPSPVARSHDRVPSPHIPPPQTYDVVSKYMFSLRCYDSNVYYLI